MSAGGTLTCLTCGALPDASPSLVPAPYMAPEQRVALAYDTDPDVAIDWRCPPPQSERDNLRDADAEACRRSLAEFCKLAWLVLHPGEPLEWSWHHDALCDHLQWLLEAWIARKEGRITQEQLPCLNLVINLPPSSLKTELMMVFAPAWMWIRWPAWRVLCLSCNPRIALDSASWSRRVIESPWYQETFRPEWALLDDQNAKSNFGTTKGGARQSHGMAAAVVGEHADAIFVDDPTDPKSVSKAELQRVNSDWVGSIQNRVTDERTAIRVLVQQRVDPEDLTGRVTSEGGWTVVAIPMEHEVDRVCATPMPCRGPNVSEVAAAAAAGGRAGARYKLNGPVTWSDPRVVAGELMTPARHPPSVLARLRRTAGPYGWSSQYQQNPRPKEGGKVKRRWFGWYKLEGHSFGTAPRPLGCVGAADDTVPAPTTIEIKRKKLGRAWAFDQIAMSIDAANQATTDGSLWGCTTWGFQGPCAFLLDDSSRLGDIDAIEELIVKVAVTWRPQKILIEPKAAGQTLVLHLQKKFAAGVRCPDGKLVRVEVVAIKMGDGDKAARLDGVIPSFYAGQVFVPEGAPFVAEYIDELTLFPNAPNDDRVDSTSQILAWALENTGVSALYKMDDATWKATMARFGTSA